jgi:hypothetical protein
MAMLLFHVVDTVEHFAGAALIASAVLKSFSKTAKRDKEFELAKDLANHARYKITNLEVILHDGLIIISIYFTNIMRFIYMMINKSAMKIDNKVRIIVLLVRGIIKPLLSGQRSSNPIYKQFT